LAVLEQNLLFFDRFLTQFVEQCGTRVNIWLHFSMDVNAD